MRPGLRRVTAPGIVVLASLFVVWFFTGLAHAAPGQARVLATEAMDAMAAKPFDLEVRRGAMEKINRAHDLDPNEAMVYVASARLVMHQGYMSGSRENPKSYAPGTIEQAVALAKKGVDLDPRLPRARLMLATLYMTQERLDEAGPLLQQVRTEEPQRINNWTVSVNYALRRRDMTQANAYLEQATRLAKTPEDRLALNGVQLAVAYAQQDEAEIERRLKEKIALQPQDAYAYGQYADHLMYHHRYAEAVPQWEKAVGLVPFRHAVDRLAEAKSLANRPAGEAGVEDLLLPQADIARLKEKGPAVLPMMATIYTRSDTKSRAVIANAFYTLGWKSPEAKAALMRDVHTDDQNLRLQVQWALGRVSNDADVVDVLLENMQNDGNPLFRDKAACALANDQIHLTEAQKIHLYGRLIEALRNPKPQVRDIASKALSIQTGQNKGFDPNAPLAQREQAVRTWQRWLEEYKANQ